METSFHRAFDARYGYLIKYTLPASKRSSAPVPPPKTTPPPLNPRSDAPLLADPSSERGPSPPVIGGSRAERAKLDPAPRSVSPRECPRACSFGVLARSLRRPRALPRWGRGQR